ncbi:ATP synthase F0 subunit B, partial [Patescibacteria group bacterium]|nr:ATP synthase F0 subunit B [Patescibacteria group bacterium]
MDLQRILGNLGFDWRMALANLVNFLIIFFVLKKYAFKPIKEKLEEREKKIKTGLEDAEK